MNIFYKPTKEMIKSIKNDERDNNYGMVVVGVFITAIVILLDTLTAPLTFLSYLIIKIIRKIKEQPHD